VESERMRVLHMVQEGKITAEDATKLLAVLGSTPEPETEAIEEPDVQEGPSVELSAPAKRPPYWLYITLFGLGWTLIGVALTLWLKGTLWLILVIPFLLIGVLIAIFGASSHSAAWLSVRVTDAQTGRRKVGIDFPVPLTLAAWGVRIARPFVPELRDTAVDEMILALRDGGARGEILMVDAIDDEDGERVQVRIG